MKVLRAKFICIKVSRQSETQRVFLNYSLLSLKHFSNKIEIFITIPLERMVVSLLSPIILTSLPAVEVWLITMVMDHWKFDDNKAVYTVAQMLNGQKRVRTCTENNYMKLMEPRY